jgi:tetratricopeptide (TPR) repeat protein
LPVLRIKDSFRWDGEFRGLATAALEAGLYDLPGVVPVISAQVPLAGKELLGAARRTVDARYYCEGPPDALNLTLELCIAGGACENITATARREAPWDALGTLLEGVATVLELKVSEETRQSWHLPGSKDTYAELLTGRAAGMYYGVIPLPDPLPTGNMHPGFRPVLVDPKQPLAQWIWARWQLRTSEEEDQGNPVENLGRAALHRSSSPLFLAERALLLLKARPEEALLDLNEIRRKYENDPRFLDPYIRALLGSGRAADALAALKLFPVEFLWSPRIARLQVEVAGAAGVKDLDPLLAHWQKIDLTVVEPVKRRIALRVDQGEYEAALSLIEALRTRAPGAETDALETALLISLGRFVEAEKRIIPDLLPRLQARRALSEDPKADVAIYLTEPSATGIAAMAEAALQRGDPVGALVLLTPAGLENAQLVALQARALELTGRGIEASAAWRRAWELDPGIEGGPFEKARIASTFQYGLAPAELPD